MVTDQDKHNARGTEWQLLAEFSLPDAAEDESWVVEWITEAVRGLTLPSAHLERLQVVLADAARNAIQRSRSFQPDLAVGIRVFVRGVGIENLIRGETDAEPEEQVIERSAQGAEETTLHPVQGWGYFLVDRTIDSPGDPGNVPRRAIELYLYPEGAERGTESTRSSAPQ